jgi:hypothetical protein
VFLDAQPRLTSSVNGIHQAFVGILSAMLLGSAVVWFRLWLTQVAIDTKVRARVCEVCPVSFHAPGAPSNQDSVFQVKKAERNQDAINEAFRTRLSSTFLSLPPPPRSSSHRVVATQSATRWYLRARVS